MTRARVAILATVVAAFLLAGGAVDAEIVSPATGTLQAVLAESGQTVAVGAVIARIST